MYLCSNWVRTRAARVISVVRLGLAVLRLIALAMTTLPVLKELKEQ